MKGAWVVLVGWGALLVAIAVVQLTMEPEAIELALLAGSGGVVVAAGAVALIAERRRWGARGRAGRPREVLRWTSGSSAALAVGICLLVLGWELGAWMIGIGAGLTALGAFGVIRETWWARR